MTQDRFREFHRGKLFVAAATVGVALGGSGGTAARLAEAAPQARAAQTVPIGPDGQALWPTESQMVADGKKVAAVYKKCGHNAASVTPGVPGGLKDRTPFITALAAHQHGGPIVDYSYRLHKHATFCAMLVTRTNGRTSFTKKPTSRTRTGGHYRVNEATGIESVTFVAKRP